MRPAPDIVLVHLDDCPHWPEAGVRLREAMRRVGLDPARVRYRRVASPDALAGFPGSPTILIEGRDAFPAPVTIGPTCRRYATQKGVDVAPSVEQLVEALTQRQLVSALREATVTNRPTPTAAMRSAR
jgi:hypothetical protein